MKKNPSSKCGIFNLRTITACAFFFVASLLSYFSFTALAVPPATITVNSTSPVIANDGFCTLPEAIISANTGMPSGSMAGECPGGGGPSGSTTIVLAIGATYTQVAAHNSSYGFNGLPQVTSTITIEGNGAIIQRGGAPVIPISNADNFRLFYISPAGNLTLRNLTVTKGLAQGGDGGVGFFAGGGGGGLGGAIYNQGTLTLSGVTLSGNTAQGGAGGVGTVSPMGFGGGSGGGGLGGTGGNNTTGYGGGGGGGFAGNGGRAGVFATTNDGGGGGGETIGSNGGDSTPLGPGAGGGTAGGAGGAFAQPGRNGLTGGGGGGGGSQAIGGGGNGGDGGGGGGGNFSNGDGDGGDGGIVGGGGGGGSENQNGGNGGVGGGGGGSGLPAGLGIGMPGSGGLGGGSGNVAGGGGGGLGGAIFNDRSATLTIFNSTLSGNSAVGGAGGASATFTGGNGGSGFGGAIFNLNGTVTINFSTIASNTVTAGAGGTGGGANGLAGAAFASGLYNHQIVGGTATINMSNAILGGTPVANCANDGGAVFTSGGYNLAQTPGATCGFTATGDLTGIDPMVAALASNGGPTQTQALQAGSQAIDRIPNGVNGCQQTVRYDQRGALRGGGAGMGDAACDTGAYEFDSTPGVELLSVVSELSHGSITPPFDITFPLLPTTSPRGVECRSSALLGAGNYMLVFTFANNLTSVANATVTSHDPATATGSVAGSAIGTETHQYIVNLTNVSTGQYITVTLNSVLDSTGASGNILSPQMGFLVGDVNFNGVASNADVSLVKAQVAAGASVGPSNFQDDINANGVISNADVSLTKAQVAAGAQLPSPP